MKALENRTLDSKKEMDIMDALEELIVSLFLPSRPCANTAGAQEWLRDTRTSRCQAQRGHGYCRAAQQERLTACIIPASVGPSLNWMPASVSLRVGDHHTSYPAGRPGPAQQGQRGGGDCGHQAAGRRRRRRAVRPGRGRHRPAVQPARHAGLVPPPAARMCSPRHPCLNTPLRNRYHRSGALQAAGPDHSGMRITLGA